MQSTNPRNFPGRRWFIAGAVILVLFGAIHVLAIFQGLMAAPPDPTKMTGAELEMAHLDETAKGVKQRLGPFEFSAWCLFQILNSSFSLLLLGAGCTNLIVCRPVAAAGRLNRLTALNMTMTAALTAVTVIWRFPIPMVFAAGATICFLISLLRQR